MANNPTPPASKPKKSAGTEFGAALNSREEHSSEVRSASRSAGSSGGLSDASAECEEHREDFQELLDEVGTSVAHYCRKRPLVAALSVFFVGFYVGWKIKPW